VVLLDVPGTVMAKRMKTRQLDRFERAGADFHARVLDGFAAMAAADPDHWAVVDASRSVAGVATDIRAIVRERCGV
jgi:dTMP kinase